MATSNLSQNRATQRLLKHRAAVATLARQAARKAVKRQLQAQGIKPYSLSVKEIRALADDYLAQHREQLVAEAKQIIATSPLFERWRWPVANISSDAPNQTEPNSMGSAVEAGQTGACRPARLALSPQPDK